mmetsp:Transcript_15691/g.15827  ORF Transcript_15691/g.15827 Transcript_15691/m.15827 type:complete len:645 (+) Transcript_15691:54-1988(+)
MIRLGLSFVLFSALLSARAQVPFVIGPNEISSMRKMSIDHLKSPSNLRDAYYSTKILSALNQTDYKCSCKPISKLVASASNGFDLFYGISTSNSCGCKISFTPEAKKSIKADLKASDLPTLAGSALAAKASGEKIASMKDVVGKIKSLMEPDGTFKSIIDGPTSIENTRIALDVLSLYSDSSTKFIISEVVGTVTKALPSGDDDSAVDPLLLASLANLAEEKIRMSASQVAVITTSLLNLYHSHDLAIIARTIESLSVIRAYTTQPLYIALSKTSFKNEESDKSLNIQVFDIFHKQVEPTSVEIKSLKKSGGAKESSLFSGKLETEDSKTRLDLSSINLTPGIYVLRIVVTALGRKSSITVEKSLSVTTSAAIKSVWGGVTESKAAYASDLTQIKAQQSFSGHTASAALAEFIHIAFTLQASKRPHQIFVRFTHTDSDTHTFFACQEDYAADETEGTKYRVAVSLAEEVETFLYFSGQYTLSILVGDVSMSPIEWIIGDLSMALSDKPKTDYPLYVKSLQADSDNTLKALPEIVHKMRGPPKRASAFMSSFFTIAAATPLIVFILFILSLKPNLNRMTSLSSVLFTCCIAAALLLYAAYWLALDGASFYETIKYICFLVPVTVIVGSGALSSVTKARVEKNKKE